MLGHRFSNSRWLNGTWNQTVQNSISILNSISTDSKKTATSPWNTKSRFKLYARCMYHSNWTYQIHYGKDSWPFLLVTGTTMLPLYLTVHHHSASAQNDHLLLTDDVVKHIYTYRKQELQAIWANAHEMCESLQQFLFAGNVSLSSSISSQFTLLQLKIAKKSLKINIFRVQGHSKSSMLTFVIKKLVVSACYDKQHGCAYLQPFTC